MAGVNSAGGSSLSPSVFGAVPVTPAGATVTYPRGVAARAADQVWIGDHCRGDGSDETAGLLEAIGRLDTRYGGTIHFDRWVTYATPIDLDRPVAFVGEGTALWNNSYPPKSRLIHSGGGSTYALNLGDATVPAARGSSFRDISVEYNNPSFTGHMVYNHVLGLRAINTSFMGMDSSHNLIFSAAAHVGLAKAHSYLFDTCMFDGAQKGLYVVDDGSHASPNQLRVVNSQFYNLVQAMIDHDPALASILSAHISGCVFNPLVLRSTHAQGQPVLGVHLKALGYHLAGNLFAPTNADFFRWADCALKLEGTGVVLGGKIQTYGTGIRTLNGHASVKGVNFLCAVPIQHEGGMLDESHNVYAYGASTWEASTAVKKGDIKIPTVPGAWVYRAQADGTTGAAEPTWPTALAGTVVNGSVTYYTQPSTCIMGLTLDGAGGVSVRGDGSDFPSTFAYPFYSSGQSATLNGFIRPGSDLTTNGVRGDTGVEVLPSSPKSIAKTSNYTVTNKDASLCNNFTNKAAAGSVTFTLPDEILSRTIMELEFTAYETQTIAVARGGASNVILGPAGSAVLLTSAGVIGNRLKLKYDPAYSTVGGWRVTGMVGTWT